LDLLGTLCEIPLCLLYKRSRNHNKREERMKSETDKWLKELVELALKEIGLKKGQIVLDFGCGDGYYTIPCSENKRTKVRSMPWIRIDIAYMK